VFEFKYETGKNTKYFTYDNRGVKEREQDSIHEWGGRHPIPINRGHATGCRRPIPINRGHITGCKRPNTGCRQTGEIEYMFHILIITGLECELNLSDLTDYLG
jgi:hypothetical protein